LLAAQTHCPAQAAEAITTRPEALGRQCRLEAADAVGLTTARLGGLERHLQPLGLLRAAEGGRLRES
jgi:hypothetical protein